MKKLRANSNEREEFLKAIRDELYMGNYGKILEDFSIEDIKTEFSKLPEGIKKPTLIIPSDIYVQMLELINQSDVECSWHGLVNRNLRENSYLIYDILVFPQINSATATTTDEKEFAEWQTKLIIDPEFPIEDLRMHGHSHVNMNVFSSGVDDQYQKDLLAKVEDGDYYIFLIMNKKMEMCIFIYDFEQQVLFEKNDIDLRITDIEDNDIRTWAQNRLKQNTTTSRPYYGPTKAIKAFEEETAYSYFGNAKPIFTGRK